MFSEDFGATDPESVVVKQQVKKNTTSEEEWKVPDVLKAYRAKERKSLQNYKEDRKNKHNITTTPAVSLDMTTALECLKKTKSDLPELSLLQYPSDAVEHFRTL